MSDYGWVERGGRRVFTKLTPPPRGQRSELTLPYIVRPFAEPVQSMADGKMYDNPRDLEKTYKASGNPQGEEYIALGNERMKTEEYVPDPKQRREDILQSIHDVQQGNIPPEIANIE